MGWLGWLGSLAAGLFRALLGWMSWEWRRPAGVNFDGPDKDRTNDINASVDAQRGGLSPDGMCKTRNQPQASSDSGRSARRRKGKRSR